MHELTKLAYEKPSELEATHQAAGRLFLERWRDVTIPLHAGAERFYREQEADAAGSESAGQTP